VLAGRAHGVPVTFTAGELPALGPRAEAALYRVAQEALHNALRHAGAAGVRVVLSKTPRQVVLEVSDDGHGFAPEAPSGGLGLASMRERAAAAGAALTIRSGQTGTLVKMTVPFKAVLATTGPVTTGPATTGPATTGPATTGPATTGPVTTGPATTGPATTGPATTGPVTTGPARAEHGTSGPATAGGGR
jgi:hypothetical protein